MDKKTQNSEDYIKDITQKEDGFFVPENYFDNIEDSLAVKISESTLPNDAAFIAPDNYLSAFDEKLLQKIDFPKDEVKVISLKTTRILKLIPTAAAAACILLFIGLNYFPVSNKITFEEVSSEELEVWFNDNTIENNSKVLLEFVDTDFTENDIIEDDTSINDDDILEYLNSINNTTLLTEIES